jgi:hypothetical protein
MFAMIEFSLKGGLGNSILPALGNESDLAGDSCGFRLLNLLIAYPNLAWFDLRDGDIAQLESIGASETGEHNGLH